MSPAVAVQSGFSTRKFRLTKTETNLSVGETWKFKKQIVLVPPFSDGKLGFRLQADTRNENRKLVSILE